MFERPGPLDFVAIARETLAEWDRDRVFDRLVAVSYASAFDDLPAQRGVAHRVVA